MKILLVGGHLSPALAVLSALPKDCDVYFFGRKYAFEGDNAVSLEYSSLKNSKAHFYEITTGRLRRFINFRSIFSLIKIPYGFFQSYILLLRIMPSVVLSFGGYLSIPVCFAATILGIPVVIHEQTLDAGLANRIIALFAKKICISWETSRSQFPASKTVLTGNPVRVFTKVFKEIPKGSLPLIFITGGSSGSHTINNVVKTSLSRLLDRYRIIHQTGDSKEFADFEHLIKYKDTLPKNLKERYVVEKFIDPEEIGSVMKASTLTISRSGINTVTEILYFDKFCLLIPLSHGQSREQGRNAQFLQGYGLATIINEENLTQEIFIETIDKSVKSNKNRISTIDKQLIRPDAATRIVKETYEAAKKES